MTKRLYSLALMCLVWLAASAQSAVSIVADPADGSVVEKLSQVTITLNGASEADLGSKANSITISSDKSYQAGCTAAYGNESNQIVVSFSEVTAEATYTLSFPDNALTADGSPVSAFTLTYTIGSAAQDGLKLTPAGGSSVTWLTDIVVAYAADETKSLSYNTYSGDQPYIENADGEKLAVDISSVWDNQAGRSTYHIMPRLLITEAGQYKLVIPEGYFGYYDESYNKVALPGAEAIYSVSPGEPQAFSSEPSKDQAVSQFQTLTITFPGAKEVKSNSSASIVLYQNAETWKGSASLSYNFTFADNTMTYSVYQPIIDGGHYTMNFPEGCVLIDGQPNAPFMVEFDIVEPTPLSMVITPAQDAAVEGILNSAVISFPEEEDVTYNPSTIALYRVTENGDLSIASAYGEATTVKQDDKKTFVVSFPGIATESGTYKIKITKNTFAVADRYNADTTVTFSYTAPEAATFEVTPARDSQQDRLQQFTISFAGDDDVTVNTALTSANILLYKGVPHKNEYGYLQGGTQISSLPLSNIVKTEGTKGEFTFSFTTPGVEKEDHALIIPAGIFLMGNKTFSQTDTVIYHVTGNGLDKIEVTPSQPVQKLKEFSFTFVNETSVVFQSSYASTSLYKVNPENTYDDYKEGIYGYESNWGGLMAIDEAQPNKVNVTLQNEYTEAGEYYISLSTYTFYMSDGQTANTVNKISVTVDPLATAITDVQQQRQATEGRIFNAAGVEVKSMSRPGLYIQNGKKVVKK